MEDIYNYDKTINKALESLEKTNIQKENRQHIKNFLRYLEVNSYSKPRIIKYICKLKLFGLNINKNFKDLTKDDIETLVLRLSKRTVKGKDLSEETKRDDLVMLKRFYKWLTGDNESYPKEVSWIKARMKNGKHKLPEELLNDEDVENLIKNATNLRDKAIISVLYDSGMRIGELLSCQIKHVKFDKNYAEIINPIGKTGSRRILLIPSVPYLLNWIENHPLKKQDSFLFINLSNKNQFKRTTHACINRMLKNLAKKCNISKRISCHQFRHASATKSARFLTDAQMKERFGWIQDSRMASVYIHMSGRDTDDAVKKMYGEEIKKEDIKDNLKPVKCPFCDTINGFENKYCRKCGRALSLEIVMEKEDKDKEMIEFLKGLEGLKKSNPEMFEIIKNIGKEKGIC